MALIVNIIIICERKVPELKFSIKWLKLKHVSLEPAKQAIGEDAEHIEQVNHEAITTAVETEIPTGPLSNDEGSNIRMIDHLTSPIKAHNRVIAMMKAEVWIILQIMDRSTKEGSVEQVIPAQLFAQSSDLYS
ncbi:hypothetical protein GOBAR_AA25971 [Gossypium barbadense]|uniref:Uncharacterized protein n=1 Tax=Gossypium barbadense TaxID=3634 RepID=A0A2P5WUC2_GOSBA|nr:hypothetical protein GOBAR_AA25971 [Gossypium barbadense]